MHRLLGFRGTFMNVIDTIADGAVSGPPTGELRKVQLLTALLEGGNRLRVQLDLPELLSEICGAIRSTLGWQFVALSLFDEASGTALVLAVAGFSEDEREGLLSAGPVPAARLRDLMREEFRVSRSFYIDHRHVELVRSSIAVLKSSPAREVSEGEWHPEDALLVPIELRGRLLGLVSVDSPSNGRRPGVEDVQALELFANQAAVAIDNSRLYQQQKRDAENQKRRAELLSALLETGNRLRMELELEPLLQAICDSIVETLGWRQVALNLRDYASGTTRPVALGGVDEEGRRKFLSAPAHSIEVNDGWLREEFRISDSYLIPHEHSEAFAAEQVVYTEMERREVGEGDWHAEDLLLVPVMYRGEILGIVSPDNPVSGRRPSEEEVQALELFSNQAAVAIVNARLFTEQRETAERLRAQAEALERANDELHRSQHQLLVSEKMAALGRLTAGIAHEINSPLGGALNALEVVRGYAAEYMASAGDPDVSTEDHRAIARDMLGAIGTASGAMEKAAHFVRAIRGQTRMEEGVRVAFDGAEEIRKTLELLRPALRAGGVEVRADLQPTTEILCDPQKFSLVLQNLVTNAADAYEGGAGTVEVRWIRGEGASILEVEDEGCGIPEDIRPRIFDYLFTTKDVGKGTGLGLALVHSIVATELSGTIEVDSVVGSGTRFRLTIPVASTADAGT